MGKSELRHSTLDVDVVVVVETDGDGSIIVTAKAIPVRHGIVVIRAQGVNYSESIGRTYTMSESAKDGFNHSVSQTSTTSYPAHRIRFQIVDIEEGATSH